MLFAIRGKGLDTEKAFELFEEYIEKAQGNLKNPGLDEIEKILKNCGFIIEIGDQGDTFDLWSEGRCYRGFVMILHLVDSYGHIRKSSEKIIAKAPLESELVLTEKGAFFLQEIGIKW